MNYLLWSVSVPISTIVCLLCSTLFAGPTAFNMEIGKTTESEVKSSYSFRSKEIDSYSGGNYYRIETSEIDFDGLKQLEITFDQKGVLVSLMAIFPKSKFDDLNEVLRKKYTLLDEDIPFVGTQIAWYSHEEATIHLEAPHLERFVSLIYMDNDYKKIMGEKIEEKEAKKKEQEASLL